MGRIHVDRIRAVVSELCISANINLKKDIELAIRQALRRETKKRAKKILGILLENAKIAKQKRLAICQDTGLTVVHISIGQDVQIYGGSLKKAINDGVKDGYAKGYFRRSIVADPLCRKRASTIPPVIDVDIVNGERMKITVSPKGFGSENKSAVKMLNPTDGVKEIKEFVMETVKAAGPNACPPFIIGIGLGGTFDRAALLAKRALMRPINKYSLKPDIRKLEKDVLNAINELGIGPMGLGGKTTCLGVNILDAPTHIAGLPVAVNVSCHATRSKSAIL